MKTIRWACALPLILALGLVLSSCGTQTTLETNWELPNASGKPLTKLAVIGIMKDKSQSTAFESAVVQKLKAQGIQAVPGFTFLEGSTDLTRPEMQKRVEATGADGVLIFKVLAQDRNARYVPPTTYAVPGAFAADWWGDPYWGYYTPYPYSYWGYWYPAMQVVASPGYWETSTTYRVQTALYRASDDKLVWTAVSATYDPTSEANLASSLSGVVIDKLEKAGLVAK